MAAISYLNGKSLCRPNLLGCKYTNDNIVKRFKYGSGNLRVPHESWNNDFDEVSQFPTRIRELVQLSLKSLELCIDLFSKIMPHGYSSILFLNQCTLFCLVRSWRGSCPTQIYRSKSMPGISINLLPTWHSCQHCEYWCLLWMMKVSDINAYCSCNYSYMYACTVCMIRNQFE